ncbi:radical SAM protein [bacterium]|nr:radical SAM protein [bacterium]
MSLLSETACADKITRIERILGPLVELAHECRLCPRQCRVLRESGQVGTCGAGWNPKIAVALPHFGEEPPLVGTKGSGTVFFSYCPLKCSFCQNYDISTMGIGRLVEPAELASIFMQLQNMGCHNLNLVSPTQSIHQIMSALLIAFRKGLNLPLVYNTSGYELPEILELLDGIIDIYLPDAKYGDVHSGQTLASASNYAEINRQAIREMFRQVGPLQTDRQGLAIRGLIVRHLVLPNRLADTRAVLRMIAEETNEQAHVSLLGQYFPTTNVQEHPDLGRQVQEFEWLEAVFWLHHFDLERGWLQYPSYDDRDMFIPNFNNETVFHFIVEKGLQECLIH